MRRLIVHIGQTLLQKYEAEEKFQNLDRFSHYIENLSERYELWIVCNTVFSEGVYNLRRRLKSILPQGRIVVFHLPFSKQETAYQEEVNSLIKKYALEQLQPDITLHMEQANDPDTFCSITVERQKRGLEVLPNGKPSLAYFSPLPPAKTGIANYSRELLPYLSQYYNIILVSEQKTTDFSDMEIYPIISVEEFEQKHETFDRILYHFGNSFYHSYMWPLLKKYPGIVVLHDFFLSGLLSYEEVVNGKTAFWTEQLFKSHGYHALQMRFDEAKDEELKYRYPCNYEILQYASSIIVHSEYAKKLAKNWYRVNPLSEWKTVPLLRETANNTDKKVARAVLGLPENALVICSFGVLNATKSNHRLLQAFLSSDLATMSESYLVFAGENNSGEYSFELEKNIQASGIGKRIKITGWIDDDTFHQYLNAADIGVQLRTASRGESSASVLDCMNYGLATIVNANGSMAELPKGALYMLEDDFKIDALIEALNILGKDRSLREDLGWKAKTFIRKYHDPHFCASRYYEAIEATRQSKFHYNSLIDALSSLMHRDETSSSIEKIAISISKSSLPSIGQHQMLIDVSVINKNDMRTGIERVVRAQLLKIINLAPDSLRIEPVYLDEDTENEICYRYARNFTSKMLNIPVMLSEEPVTVTNGDIFYAPDFYPQGVIKAAEDGLYQQWREKGVKVSFLIHDILPIQYPHFFPEESSELHNQWMKTITQESDILICTSNTGAENVRTWIQDNYMKNSDMLPAVETVYLGSDITASAPSSDLPEEAEQVLTHISQLPTFLIVGTIEPRKGHLQTIAAFDKLWEKGMEVNLVIVGKEGWKGLPDARRRTIPETISLVKQHTQLGKHLFWLNDISDLFLEKLYNTSTALIVSSEDEGFGLPLIEGAHYGLPLIVRDIPIFRELAENNAFYFQNTTDPMVIADAVEAWLVHYHEAKHPLSEALATINWKESAQGILNVLLDSLKNETNTILWEEPTKKSDIVLSYRAEEIYRALSRSSQSGDEKL